MIKKIKRKDLTVFSVIVGPLGNNCYLVFDQNSKDALVIDPGDEPPKIEKIIQEEKLKVKFILITHGHFDHTGAVEWLRRITGTQVFMDSADRFLFPGPTQNLAEDQIFPVGQYSFRVIKTPGHSPGSICLFGEGILFSGDTLFAGGCGRTDLPGSDKAALENSLKKIFKKLAEDTLVLPGHGPATTLADEKNIFLNGLV